MVSERTYWQVAVEPTRAQAWLSRRGLSTPADIQTASDDSGVVIARIAGEMDASNTSHVENELTAAVPNSAPGLVLDLSDLSFVDSSGVELSSDSGSGSRTAGSGSPSRCRRTLPSSASSRSCASARSSRSPARSKRRERCCGLHPVNLGRLGAGGLGRALLPARRRRSSWRCGGRRYRIVTEPPMSRHFTAQFAPIADAA